MRELVENAGDVSYLIPNWKPDPSIDEEMAEHFSRLCIPADPRERPCLLLHRLGECPKTDANHSPHFHDIFQMDSNVLLLNTSGAGKTRFLLDGLCSRWGFYFVGLPDSAGIGSSDLAKFIKELDDAKRYKNTDKARKVDRNNLPAFDHMQNVAQLRFLQLLLARFLILNLLIEQAKLSGGIHQNHRRLWVLLQVQPYRFSKMLTEDLFLMIARELEFTSANELKDRISKQHTKLQNDMEDVMDPDTGSYEKPPVYCILDEAQVTSTQRLGEFRSKENKLVEHPVLREIWLAWTTVLAAPKIRIIISGTNIDIEQIKSTLASSHLKMNPLFIHSTLGGFDDSESQAKFIKHYILAAWDEQKWKEFLIRSFAWFRGRYRNTATLIVLLLLGGYKCPHRTVDGIVEAFASFKPTEAVDWVAQEPDFPPVLSPEDIIDKLDFDKMSPMQAKTLSEMLHKQFFTAVYSVGPFPAADRTAFVEYGIARIHIRGGQLSIDEPFIKVAAQTWLKRNPVLSLSEWCRSHFDVHSFQINGFEAYTTHYMLKILEKFPQFDAVFTLRKDHAQQNSLTWLTNTLELVTVSKGVYSSDTRISVVTQSSGPSANIGFRANSSEDVLEWMSENKQQVAFCYPPPHMGPDMLFFVRSQQSKKLILVAIQAKKREVVDRNVLVEDVRTVTPNWFWRRRITKFGAADEAPCLNEEAANRVQEILREIPNRQQFEGAEYPVLRVFASFPGKENIERTNQQETSGTYKTIDDDKHLLASLNESTFAELNGDLDELSFQRGQKKEDLKRHFVEEEDEEEPASMRKRPRQGSADP
ncbi:hypothetical protein CPB86DRAFT_49855 [Serendipita vermifera]|nr:hypothetical protein CPB86DRAFT_49855 [Serendipita vermifera]